MKAEILLLPFVLGSALASEEAWVHKRAVSYVTMVSTTNIPLADYLAAASAVPAAPAAPVANKAVELPGASTSAGTTSSSSVGSRLVGWLDSFFGLGGTSNTPTTTSAAPVAPAAPVSAPSPSEVATPVVSAGLAAGPVSSDDSQYTYSGPVPTETVNWWDNLFADESGTASANAAPTGGLSINIGYSASIVASGIIPSVSIATSTGSVPSGGSSSPGDYGEYNGIVEYATKAKGVTYSPYIKSGSCKSAQQVANDFEKLAPFSLIRLYSTDCSCVENTLAAISSSQKLFLGIYNIDSNTITSGLQTIKSAVEASSRGWSAVDTISIGNEQVNDGKATVQDIQTALNTARSWLKSNAPQYSGSVVTVDTLVAVKNNPGLCDLSDYLAVNCHPYWDGSVQPSNAGPWLQNQISGLQAVCGNSKEVFITETGWPNKGSNFGSCVPSVANEEAAFKSISGVTTNYLAFTTYNDPWKPAGQYGVESNWGIFGESPE
ncbi:cell surface mannoprotein Mp65p [[Candida] anglica]|uniref:Cell surface mannoprotein Mp65p n=1 Tax=[Candida] anglica TaxID=148631 RepID=A0ABP0EK76_9ASCO